MKPLFNFQDPKFNEGFQIDMSLLTEKQRNHVLQMFEARGVKWMGGESATERTDTLWGGYGALIYKNGTLAQGQGKFEQLPPIPYPELCRGAVQLEHGNWTKMYSIAERENLILYAANTAEMAYLYENGAHMTTKRILFQVPSGKIAVVGLSDDTAPFSHLFLSPAEFEQKLLGISPVVRETTENQSADNAQPKYFKAKKSGVIIQWLSDLGDELFKGVVVYSNFSKYKVGDNSWLWQKSGFEPCEYTPNIKVVDSPAVEQPIPSDREDVVLGYYKRIENQNKRLYNENTRLKNDAKTDQATISRINEKLDEANEDKQKLEQENAQLKEQQQNTWSEKETLKNALAKIVELKDRNEALNKLNNEYELLNGKLTPELAKSQKVDTEILSCEISNRWISEDTNNYFYDVNKKGV